MGDEYGTLAWVNIPGLDNGETTRFSNPSRFNLDIIKKPLYQIESMSDFTANAASTKNLHFNSVRNLMRTPQQVTTGANMDAGVAANNSANAAPPQTTKPLAAGATPQQATTPASPTSLTQDPGHKPGVDVLKKRKGKISGKGVGVGLAAIGNAAAGVADAVLPKVTNSETGDAIMGGVDAVADVASQFGPWGAAAGAALKIGSRLVNSLASHKMSSINVDQDTLNKVGAGYSASAKNITEMAKHNGEKVGAFSFEKANEWEFNMDRGRRDQAIMGRIAAASELAKAGGDFEGNAIRNQQMLNGGAQQVHVGKHGIKLELDWARRARKMQEGGTIDGGELQEVIVTAPKVQETQQPRDIKEDFEQLKKEWKALDNIKVYLQEDPNFEVNWGDTKSYIEYIGANQPQGLINYFDSLIPWYHIKSQLPGTGTLYYNPNKVDVRDLKLDALHAFREQDPVYRHLLRDFEQSIDWENNLYAKSELQYNGDKDNTVDGFLRNLLIQDEDYGFWTSRRYDNPANAVRLLLSNSASQLAFDRLVDYLKTGKADGRPVHNAEFMNYTDLNNNVQLFRLGGTFNVIPEGALHKNKHHMEDDEHITKKGIPVISEEKEGIKLLAEIECNEIILHLALTLKLEKLYEDGSDEAAIEAGKLLVQEILHNTDDRTGLLNEVE